MMKPGDGRLVGTRPMADCRISVLSHMMLGRPLTEMFPPKRNTPGQTLLKVEGLSRPGMFHDITFELRAGEILGIAGLVGSWSDRDRPGRLRGRKSRRPMHAGGTGFRPPLAAARQGRRLYLPVGPLRRQRCVRPDLRFHRQAGAGIRPVPPGLGGL